ncbi:MAG: maleylpyruvate isomerase family mycothiol-dependent enzyme [Pseudonocardia sp.]|nr:maleylpyruvate isomerase family mycothiol-dependent enzyme [Pseudonocardia sp.]
MTQSGTAAYRSALTEQNALLRDLARGVEPEIEIPTCPGWTVAKLLTHVGRGHRWAAAMTGSRATEPLDLRQVPDGKPPGDPQGLDEWLRTAAEGVLEAVDRTGEDAPIWTFTGPRPAAWWIRRRLHEETAHRADLALALDRDVDLEPWLAADGLSEWLDLLTADRPGNPGPLLDEGKSLHLHATDEGLGQAGEWTVRPAGGVIAWEPGHAKGSVAVRGPAEALYLMMLGRVPADDPRLQVLGEEDVLTDWLARTSF